jgi:adenylate cyclase
MPNDRSKDSDEFVSSTTLGKISKPNYVYDPLLELGKKFLLNYVNSKIHLVILYADLVGSTDMCMTLPVDKLVIVIQSFLYEMSSVIQDYKGYVLKFVGDAVIAFFPSSIDKSMACNQALQCAKSMISVIQDMNSLLIEKGYPELSIKIGMDEGENVIVKYGSESNSVIDILGYCMSICAKITSITYPNAISIGEDVYNSINIELKKDFNPINFVKDWKYANRKTGNLYRVYMMKP